MERKISFLGDLLIIIVIVVFVYLFLNQTSKSNISEIIKINEKYQVSSQVLIPSNNDKYLMELNAVSEKEFTSKVNNFLKLNQEITYIENSLYRTKYIGEECISRDLKFRINGVYLKSKSLISDFEEINIKKYNRLNIDSYILFLNEINKKYTYYKIDSEKIPVCS